MATIELRHDRFVFEGLSFCLRDGYSLKTECDGFAFSLTPPGANCEITISIGCFARTGLPEESLDHFILDPDYGILRLEGPDIDLKLGAYKWAFAYFRDGKWNCLDIRIATVQGKEIQVLVYCGLDRDIAEVVRSEEVKSFLESLEICC